MALSGYIFSDKDEIKPLLEDPFIDASSGVPSSSPSLHLARDLALRLRCFVIVGFPLSTAAKNYQDQTSGASIAHDARSSHLLAGNEQDDSDNSAYNAALLVDERGTLLHVFRKHFNYEDDKRWAQEGPGFQTITLPKLGKVCVAICMDLNPYDFRAAFDAFELARYCKQEQVDILIMPMAWLISSEGNEDIPDAVDNLKGGPNADTINYWATRLSPFLFPESKSTATNQRGKDFFFVSCNRTGTEAKSKFAGSSCALHFQGPALGQQPNATVELLDAMGREEGVQVVNLPESHVTKRV